MIKFYLNQTVVKYYFIIKEIHPNKKCIINLLINENSHLAQLLLLSLTFTLCSEIFDIRLLVGVEFNFLKLKS